MLTLLENFTFSFDYATFPLFLPHSTILLHILHIHPHYTHPLLIVIDTLPSGSDTSIVSTAITAYRCTDDFIRYTWGWGGLGCGLVVVWSDHARSDHGLAETARIVNNKTVVDNLSCITKQ